MHERTSLKISKELNLQLLINAKLNGYTKEAFVEMLLKGALKPYIDTIDRVKVLKD